MKASLSMLALLAAAAFPAFAAPDPDAQEIDLQTVRAEMAAPAPISGYRAWQLLGLETNLTAKDVHLVLTTVARDERYRFRADRDMARQFEQSLGSERYADLVAGLPVELHSPAVLEAARNMTASASGARDRDPQPYGRVAVVIASNP